MVTEVVTMVTEDEVAKLIRADYEAGVPQKELAKKYRKSLRDVSKTLKDETPEKLQEEAQADEAEAALEMERKRKAALERLRKAEVERLELEAMEDPKKILPYLKILGSEAADEFFHICDEARLDPEMGWRVGVNVLGETWEARSRVSKAEGKEPSFGSYAASVMESFIVWKKRELAVKKHSDDRYGMQCERCGLRYEYELGTEKIFFSCPNGCRTSGGYESFFYYCPACRDLGSDNSLFYDYSTNVLYCKACGYRVRLQGQPLEEKGTKKGTLKREVTDLEESKRALDGELSETQRKINAGEGREQALERGIREKEQTCANLSKNIATLSAESEKNRQGCVAELRRAEKLKGENKHVEELRKVFTAVADFSMDPELITGEQLAKVVNTLSVALNMRKQQGHVGEAVKMTVEERDWLVEKLAGGRYILREEADKMREEQLARQRGEYEVQLKLKEHRIAEERRLRETAERERETLAPWRDKDMDKLRRENRQLRDRILNLEGELSDLRSRGCIQRLISSS
jgi:transcription elongation factor Elf1